MLPLEIICRKYALLADAVEMHRDTAFTLIAFHNRTCSKYMMLYSIARLKPRRFGHGKVSVQLSGIKLAFEIQLL